MRSAYDLRAGEDELPQVKIKEPPFSSDPGANVLRGVVGLFLVLSC